MALLLVILVPLAALVIYAIAFDLSERLINRAVGQMAPRGIGRPAGDGRCVVLSACCSTRR